MGEGSAFGNIGSITIDLVFVLKHGMIYSQALSAGAKRALSVSSVIIPLQDEININDIGALFRTIMLSSLELKWSLNCGFNCCFISK